MQLCMSCGRIFDDEDILFVLNRDFDNEEKECFPCHYESMKGGWIMECESCGEYFTGDHLIINPETDKEELCPYCGEVWFG